MLKVVQDRAVGAAVAVALGGTVLEGVGHGAEVCDLGAQFGDVVGGDPLDLAAGALPIESEMDQ